MERVTRRNLPSASSFFSIIVWRARPFAAPGFGSRPQLHAEQRGCTASTRSPQPLQVTCLPAWEQAYINAALMRLVALLGAGAIDASPVLDVGAVTDLPDDRKS